MLPVHRLLLCAAATLLLFQPLTAADVWQAGVAKANITPDEYMWMAGYGGRNAPASGKLTDLWAKALVLQAADGQRCAVVTLDLVGIDRGLSQRICQELAEKHQLKRDQVALCTSHTHTGPVVAENLRPMHYAILNPAQQKQVRDYAVTLREKIVKAVGQAMDDLAPAELSYGTGTATFAVNRRNNAEGKVPQLRADGKLVGPFDHDVPVLAVRRPNGKLAALLFGYACHSTVLSFNQWSGDYPGYAQIELEKSHPDCLALFWAGCGADQNPLPRRKVEYAQEYGARLAAAVDKVVAGKLTPLGPRLATSYQEIPLALGTLPGREQIEQDAKSNDRYVASRARALLAQLDKDGQLAQTYPYPVQIWRMGDDLKWVTLGGEVVVDYSLRLKSELGERNTWVAGYANDVMAYIPSRRVLQEGGYEGARAMIYYGLPCPWSPAVEESIVEEVHRQAKAAR